jgi:hypothetical protein
MVRSQSTSDNGNAGRSRALGLMKDFTPTSETVSLHGLGFIQIVLPCNRRLHVWHPELPRRECYLHSAVHNHRFGFRSDVLKGTQINVPVDIELARGGTHRVISHNGPRSALGGRESYEVAECNLIEHEALRIEAGGSYWMAPGAYHHTPCEGIVITLMTKLAETSVHANSIIAEGIKFHSEFDRFQLTPMQLLAYVCEAFSS